MESNLPLDALDMQFRGYRSRRPSVRNARPVAISNCQWLFEILDDLPSLGRLNVRALKSVKWLRARWIAGEGSKSSPYPGQSPGREPDSTVGL